MKAGINVKKKMNYGIEIAKLIHLNSEFLKKQFFRQLEGIMAKFSDYLKNIFFLLLFLQVAPLLIQGIKKQYTNLLEPRSKVGVLSMTGMLTDSQFYVKNLKKFFHDSDIKAILLKIDCPGGTAGTAQAIFMEIKALKADYLKPVIVLIENMCTSGAYYVACSADSIIAPPSAFIGSIGVYIPQPQLKEFIEQFKLKYDVIKTGEYKTTGDPFLAQTAEQTALLHGLTNDTYNQFADDVAQSRPQLLRTNANNWANGKIFTGRQAKEIGLIDELGSQSTAEKILKLKAPIEGEIEWVKPQRPSAFAAFFRGHDNDDSSDGDSYIASAISSICNCLENRWAIRAY